MEKNEEILLRGSQFKFVSDRMAMKIREKYGLKKADIDILFYLAENPEHNTGRDTQDFFKMNKGYISQVVDHLCGRGLLVAVTDKEDRRYVHYIVTDKAQNLIDEIAAMKKRVHARVFAGVSEEERKIFQKVAGKIEKNIMEMLGE